MGNSAQAYDEGMSGSKNPGEPSGSIEGDDELLQGADTGSKNRFARQQEHSEGVRAAASTGSSHPVGALEQIQKEHRQRLMEQERDLRRLQQRFVSHQDTQSDLSGQVETVNERMDQLDKNMASLEQELSGVHSELETFITEDSAYDVADEKINDRIVRPIFLFISLLSLAVGIISFASGPVIVGIALTSVTVVAWYLLYLSR